jgi:hypothetical protein
VQVVEQRVLGVDRQDVDVTAAGAHRDLALLVRERRRVEQLGQRLAPLDLDEQHASTAGRERQRERGGDRRLAGAALAGHDVQPHAREVRHTPRLCARRAACAGGRV